DRVTFDLGDEVNPLWSPDGSAMAFSAFRKGDLLGKPYRKLLSGPPNSEEPLFSTSTAFLQDWSSDGRFLLYDSLDPTTGVDIWAVRLDGDRKPFEVVKTEFTEGLGQFSPNVKWIAYQSDKTGRQEIYIRPFPGPGSDVAVSSDGGAQPRWNRNGNEL